MSNEKQKARKEGKAKYEINDGSNSSLPCLLVIPTLNSPFKDILRQSACGNPGGQRFNTKKD